MSPKCFYCVNDRMKALLFTLIRAFEFDLAISAKDLGTTSIGVQHPVPKEFESDATSCAPHL